MDRDGISRWRILLGFSKMLSTLTPVMVQSVDAFPVKTREF